MKNMKYIAVAILALVWGVLCWYLLTLGGINLKNLLVCAMTGIIIFVPLWKKYFK